MKWLIIGFLIIAVAIVATACITEGIERAKAQERDAAARAASAPIVAQAVVIEAETNATLEKLRALTDINKEMRTFDAQLARQEFATTVLEFQALNLAIRQETEAARQVTAELEEAVKKAEPIGHNAEAAARNTWYTNLILGVFGIALLGQGVALVVFTVRSERRLALIASGDEAIKNRG